MNLQTLIPLVLLVSVLLLVFAIGARASWHDATYLFRRPGELLRAVLAMNILMPLFAVVLIMLFDFHPAVKIAVVAMSVSPIPPLLPGKLMKSGGTESYAVGLLIAAGVLSIITVPLSMEILARVFNLPLQMTASAVASTIAIGILIPIAIGLLAHHFAPAIAERLSSVFSKVAGIALLVSLLAILVSAAPAIWTLIGNGTVIAFALFAIAGLAIGHFLGGPQPENRVALAVSTASRHPGIAIAIAAANFPQEKLVLASVLLYLLVNAVVSIPYLSWIRRQSTAAEPQPEG